jgi:hypothetical protein
MKNKRRRPPRQGTTKQQQRRPRRQGKPKPLKWDWDREVTVLPRTPEVTWPKGTKVVPPETLPTVIPERRQPWSYLANAMFDLGRRYTETPPPQPSPPQRYRYGKKERMLDEFVTQRFPDQRPSWSECMTAISEQFGKDAVSSNTLYSWWMRRKPMAWPPPPPPPKSKAPKP